MNKKGAPRMALIIVSACALVVLVVAHFAADAYTFAISMCTVTIITSWSLAAAYQIKLGIKNGSAKSIIFGAAALTFQVASVLLSGWTWMLLSCLGYIPGFYFYLKARKEGGAAGLTKGEKVACTVIALLGAASIPLTIVGVIPVF